MSCVVGIVDEDRVWIGGDSAASDKEIIVSYTAPKVFRRGRMVMGCVESFRMRDLIDHYFIAPRCTKDVADEAYISSVIEALRECFKAHDYSLEDELDEDEKDENSVGSGAILIGFRGRLFTVDWDYHMGEVLEPYMAIGAGAQFALGSLTESADKGYSPRLRLLNALKVSAHYSTSVGPPFKILSGK